VPTTPTCCTALKHWLTAALLTTAALLAPAVVLAAAVDIDADQVIRGADGVVTASGNVIIKRTDETLAADQVIYRTRQHIMEARGHVIIRSANATIHADAAQLQTQSKTGTIDHATITLPGGERLQAEQVKRIDDQRFEAEHVIYSSCPADAESWRIAASHAVLDQEEGSLTTRNPRFELWQVPVLYVPWWRQTLKRKTGLLMPSFNFGKRRGTEIAQPFYLAAYQNWDATLTPHWMSARGVMGEAEFRHVSGYGHERLAVAGINDRASGRQRGRLQADTQWQLPADARLTIDADHVSDRDYLADFSTDQNISARYLQSNAILSQHLQNGDLLTDWSLQVQHQQDLLLSSNAATLHMLPRLQSRSQWQVHPNAAMYLDQQTTRFQRRSGVDGWRMDVHPYIELPWQSSGGGVSATFNAGLRHTRYWLLQTTAINKRPSRTTQEASLEIRSSFERIYTTNAWRHLISPVVRYDYVNAPDQSTLPNFDSSFSLLTWSSLLSGNRFAGYDRIENSSRISMMLENRFQHKTDNGPARDVLIARAGVAYDMRRNSVDPLLKPALATPFSNLLGEVTLQPVSGVSLYGSGQYNPANHYWASAHSHLQLTHDIASLYLGYQLTDRRYSTESRLIDLNTAIKIGPRWRAHASWQYDNIRKVSQQAAIGAQYQHPCWTIGAEAFRTNRASGSSSNSSNLGMRILLEIKGLGSVGS